MTEKQLTGRHVLIIAVSAFGLIIGVNLFMAYEAVGTFPGLETKNSYVASQHFDADRAAQEALGWQVSADVAGDTLRLTILDAEGRPVNPASVTGILGWATSTLDDQTPEFHFDGEANVAKVVVDPGNWNLRLVATAADGTVFRQRVVIHVKDPA